MIHYQKKSSDSVKERVGEESQDEEGVKKERDFSQIPKTNQHNIHRSSPPQKIKLLHSSHPSTSISTSANSSVN